MRNSPRSILRIAAACVFLANCSAPSLSPQLQTSNTLPYSGQPQSISYTQNGYSGTLTLPAALSSAPRGDNIMLIASQTTFNASPALQSSQRRPSATMIDVPLIYFNLSVSATTVFSQAPSLSIVLPSDFPVSSGPFYVAFYDSTATNPAWNYLFEGPGEVADSTVTFTPLTNAPFTLQAGVHYFFCLYQSQANASPAPSPSAAPSATPAPAVSASPTPRSTASAVPTSTPAPIPSATPQGSLHLTSSSLSLNGAGSTYAQQTALQETGYVGTFSESDTCSSIATVSSGSGTGPSSTITVTGLNSGTCAATFRDAYGQSAVLSVSVTVGSFSISMTTKQ